MLNIVLCSYFVAWILFMRVQLMSKTTAGLRIAAKHCGKFSAPAPSPNVPADVGNDDIGEGGRAPFPLFLLPFAAVDDVLVISADAARDVAAVAVPARHGVGGATLPPDAPPQPLKHRVIRSSRECASKPGKRTKSTECSHREGRGRTEGEFPLLCV